MKLYDKIWAIEKEEAPHPIQSEVSGPIICLTVKELRNLWYAAVDYGEYPHLSPDFTQYLKEQGIQLPHKS